MKYNIGIDIGGMSIKAGLVNLDGEIIESSVIPTEKVSSLTHIQQIAKQIEDLLIKTSVKKEDINGVGIGVPGAVDSKNGKVIFAPNINWKSVNVCEELSKILNLPCKVGNDADVATLAEVYFGVAKNYDTAVMITVGTGVGSGIVVDNKLYDKCVSAEIGHMVIVYDGIECGCGRKGCFEQYASATALIRQTKEMMLKDKNSLMWEFCENNIDNVNGITSFACAKKGDKSANIVVDNFVKYLSCGILNILNILRPQAIIIGGGISKEKDYLVDKIKENLKDLNYGYLGAPESQILCAELKNSAGIVGASSLFINK